MERNYDEVMAEYNRIAKTDIYCSDLQNIFDNNKDLYSYICNAMKYGYVMGYRQAAFGARLVALRGTRTQEEVAEALGITLKALRMYEKGTRIPRDEIKIAISDYYNTPIYELF